MGEEISTIFLGPVVTEVDHGSDVGVSAEDGAGTLFSRAAFAMAIGRDGFAEVKEGEIGAAPTFAIGGDEVAVVAVVLRPVMSITEDLADRAESPGTAAVGHEEGAVGTVVETPLIGSAVGVDFEVVSDGMESPDAGLEIDAFFLGSARLADEGIVKNAVTAVKPAVVAPKKRVWRFVRVPEREAVEKDLGWAVGFVIAIGIGDEEEFGSAGREDASVADFEAADEVEIVGEDFVGFERAIAVLVLENDDAIAGFFVGASPRIGEGFGDPDAAPAVEGESDGLAELRFAGDGFDLETFRDEDATGDVVWLSCRIRFEVPKERAGGEAGRVWIRGSGGLLFVKAEIVVVEVAPRAGMFIDEAEADHFSEVGAKIDGVLGHVLDFASTACFVDDLAGLGVDDFNVGFGKGAGSDAIGCPWVGDFEGLGSECSLSLIGVPEFVAADPEVAVVRGISATPDGDAVAFDWAFVPNGSGFFPALIVALFESNVGGVGRDDSFGGFLGGRRGFWNTLRE